MSSLITKITISYSLIRGTGNVLNALMNLRLSECENISDFSSALNKITTQLILGCFIISNSIQYVGVQPVALESHALLQAWDLFLRSLVYLRVV